MASQTRPHENLRLKTKFGLVIAIFLHLAKRERERKRARTWLREEKEFVISSPCNQGTSLLRRRRKKKGKRIKV